MPTTINASGQTITNHAVQVGGASNVLASVAPGTSGNVLTSNGTDWTSAAAAASGVTGPGSSTNNGIATWNGTGGAALFSRATPLVSSGGVMTNSNQPCFFAYLGTTQTNVTGDGTFYTIQSLTATVNQGSGLNTTSGVFTAPVAGVYFFGFCVNLSGLTNAWTDMDVTITATSITLNPINNINPGVIQQSNLGLCGSGIVVMSANDTCSVTVGVSGSTKNVNVFGAAGSGYTYFYGYLIC